MSGWTTINGGLRPRWSSDGMDKLACSSIPGRFFLNRMCQIETLARCDDEAFQAALDQRW
jgi:hypothetical protein